MTFHYLNCQINSPCSPFLLLSMETEAHDILNALNGRLHLRRPGQYCPCWLSFMLDKSQVSLFPNLIVMVVIVIDIL